MKIKHITLELYKYILDKIEEYIISKDYLVSLEEINNIENIILNNGTA